MPLRIKQITVLALPSVKGISSVADGHIALEALE